jgi:RES domain-containing protein
VTTLPLPAQLGGAEFVAWRLDRALYAATWDSGEGAYRFGGRWNSKGVRAVYCALDPGTAILEAAVHKGFRALDTLVHVLTSLVIADTSEIHVIQPDAIPNPNWLHPGIPSAGQQEFGDELLARRTFVLIPSAVSAYSWNLIFVKSKAAAAYSLRSQELFASDTRLHPPA